MRWFDLRFPADLDSEQVTQFMRSLAARPRRGSWRLADPMVFEVGMHRGQLCWRLAVSRRDADLVLANLRLSLPQLRIAESSLGNLHAETKYASELRLTSRRRPLRSDRPEEASAALLAALSESRSDEVIVLRWLVGPSLPRRVIQPTSANTPSTAVLGGMFDLSRPPIDSEQRRALDKKQSEPVFGVIGRIGIASPRPHRQLAMCQRVLGALQVVRAPGVGFERRLLPDWWVRARLRDHDMPAFAWPSVLNASELTAVLGWPLGNPVLPGVSYRSSRQLAPSTMSSSSSSDRVTGESTYPGRSGLLALPAPAALHHLHIAGPTGVGKSTLTAQLALQDIAANRPVVVFDPSAKGDLIRDIADRIPQSRLDQVVILDPAAATPVGLNVLAGAMPDVVVDGIVHILHELHASSWGPRTADVLHHGLLSLARHGDMTLCELPPLLLNETFRRQVLQQVGPDALGVGPFWQWFNALSDSERAAVIGPSLNKLRAFTQRPAVRAVIGQTSGFDLATIFTQRRSLLIRLSPGEIGSESAFLLGSLIMGQLWQVIQGRGAIPAERRHPVFVYLDEFQQLLRLPVDLGDALTQARGLGVGLVLAHQSVAGQLSSNLRAATLANTRSRIVFTQGHDDAALLARHLGHGLTAADLQGLAAFETYQVLHGSPSPVSARTLPLGPGLGSLRAVEEGSQRFGQARQEVDAALVARRSPPAVVQSAPIGARKRRGRS